MSKNNKNSVQVMEIVGPVDNNRLAEFGLQTADENRKRFLPESYTVFGKTGKELGTVQHFTGSLSARDIKEKLKASGFKGKELQRKVQSTLRGETNMRQLLGSAWLQVKFQEGYTVDLGRENKAKTAAKLQLVKVAPVAPAVVEKLVVTRESALAVLGLSEADIEAIQALIAAKE